MNKISFDEFEQLYYSILKFLPLRFYSYYKYSFAFVASTDKYEIMVSLGGDSSDIYRLEIQRDKIIHFPDTLKEIFSDYYEIKFRDKLNNKTYTHYHFGDFHNVTNEEWLESIKEGKLESQ